MSFQLSLENCQGFSIPDRGGKIITPARNGERKCSGKYKEIKRGVTWDLFGSLNSFDCA